MYARKPWIALIVALPLTLGLAACGGDGDGGNGARDEEPTSSPWLDLLSHVPDNSDTRSWVVMNDYARVREEFGIPLPEADADAQTLSEYAERLWRDEQMAFRGLYGAIRGLVDVASDEWRTELGFTLPNVDQEVEAGEAPELYRVLRGRFDREAIDEAVRTDPIFSDVLEEASHRGVDYYTWGEDFRHDYERTSAVRPLGRGHRLAVHGDSLYWAQWTEGLEEMIDAGLGERPSLADLEQYQILAEGLDRLDTYTALLTEDSQELVVFLDPDPATEALQEALQRERRLLPYLAFATGAGADADGPYLAIVLLHADEETARGNVRRLEQRIREGTSVFVYPGEPWSRFFDDSEISTDGRLVLAKLHTTETGLWIQFVLTRDPLLLAP